MQNFREKIPQLLKEFRTRAGMTQLEVALKLNTSLRSYQRFESGESEPSLSQTYNIIQLLNIKVEYIFGEEFSAAGTSLISQFSQLFESVSSPSSMGMWEYDPKTERMIWSESMFHLLKVDRGTTLTFSLFNSLLCDGAQSKLLSQSMMDCDTQGLPFSLTLEMKNKSGECRFFKVSGARGPQNGKSFKIYGSCYDLTELKSSEQKLAKSLSDINHINDTAEFGRWELDLRSNELKWSDSLYVMFGTDPEKQKPSYEFFLSKVHPEDRTMVAQAYSRSLETKEAYEIEHRIFDKNGKVKWILEKCTTFYDSSGRPEYSVGYTLDISKWKSCPKDHAPFRPCEEHLHSGTKTYSTCDSCMRTVTMLAEQKAKVY